MGAEREYDESSIFDMSRDSNDDMEFIGDLKFSSRTSSQAERPRYLEFANDFEVAFSGSEGDVEMGDRGTADGGSTPANVKNSGDATGNLLDVGLHAVNSR